MKIGQFHFSIYKFFNLNKKILLIFHIIKSFILLNTLIKPLKFIMKYIYIYMCVCVCVFEF